MKKVLIIILGIVGTLLITIIVNTLRFSSKQIDVEFVEGIKIDNTKAAKRLSLAVKLQTISYQKSEDFVAKPFVQMIDLISDSFPKVEANLEKKVINRYSLLYKWSGKNPKLKPVTFLAHLDVVPAEPGTEKQWTYPVFSGAIADGFIWGRGTLDDKSSAFAVLEAVEQLLKQGFVPNRTIYLAFGHDEEVGGHEGAVKIAEYFKKQGVTSLFTLDEGMVIMNEKLSAAKKTTGIIGIAEKGYTTLKLTAKGAGGHSSLPSNTSSVGILARAITAIEENQMPSSLSGPSKKMFDYLGPEMGFFEKMLFANQWLFRGVIISILEEKASTAAMIRTTTAVTMINAGVQENVLASHATAVVNFRILPGDSSKDVLDHVEKVVANPAVHVEFLKKGPQFEPSKVSSTDTPEFEAIGKSISQIFKGAIVSPGLSLVMTDSKHYADVSENSYRFAPHTFGPEDLGRIHGVDERIGVDDYALMIKFYAQLILNLNQI
ncbi:MAG: M20 family peptidase [Leptospirales bacterium]